MATAGSIVIDLLMRTGAFETDSKRAEKRLKEMQKAAKQFGVAVGAAVAAAGTAITAVTVQAIQFADSIDEMSQRVGISTETLSGWAYAANLSGTSLDGLGRSLPRLAKAMAGAQEEGSRLDELFKSLGISTVDAEGNLREVEDVLPELADRFKALDNDTVEAALAMELFGKSGVEMLEFLNRGSDGIRELTDRARELGVVVDGETAAAAAEFNDRLDDLKAMSMAFGMVMAEELLPHLVKLVTWLTEADNEGSNLDKTARGLATTLSVIAEVAFRAFKGLEGLANGFVALQSKAVNFATTLIPQFALLDQLTGGKISQASADLAVVSGARAGEAGQGMMDGLGLGRGEWNGVSGSNAPTAGTSLDDRLAKIKAFLENPTGGNKGGGGSGKSEAEKQAEALQRAYESMNDSLDRQQFMLGQTGEEARLRYEIEMGALKDLAPELQSQLLAKAALLDAEIAAREEAEKQAELDARATEAFEEMNARILEQIELIGMSADEQEIYVNLAWAGVDAESERGKIIAENTRRLQEQREQLEDQIGAMDDIRDEFKGIFSELREGGNPLQVLEDALDRILMKLADRAWDNLIDGLLGKSGDPGGGSVGGSIFGWLGGLFGGSRAGGGDTIAGRSYLVGEQGPEMFVPRTAGAILPAERTAGMVSGHARPGGSPLTVVVQGATSRRAIERIRMERDRVDRKAQREFA